MDCVPEYLEFVLPCRHRFYGRSYCASNKRQRLYRATVLLMPILRFHDYITVLDDRFLATWFICPRREIKGCVKRL